MQVSINKNIELLYVAALIRNNKLDYLVTEEQSNYAYQIKKTFGKFSNHNFFKMFTNNILASDVAFEIINPNNEEMSKIVLQLQHFGTDINFDDFFKLNTEYYNNLINNFKNYLATQNIENYILSFYKLEKIPFSYSIILVPSRIGAGSVTLQNNRVVLLIGNKIENGKTTFNNFKTLGSIFHEMSHPIIKQHTKPFAFSKPYFQNKPDNDFNFLNNKAKDYNEKEISYYKNKYILFEEYCVRAVTDIYMNSFINNINERLNREQNIAGFIYIKQFYNAFSNYNDGKIKSITETLNYVVNEINTIK